MKRLTAVFLPFALLLSLSCLLCGCIPEDLSDCPDSPTQNNSGVEVTIGLDQPGSGNGQETQLP